MEKKKKSAKSMRIKKAEKNYKEAVKKDPPGEGGRFKAMTKIMEARGDSEKVAKAKAAAIGRAKYGNRGMAKMSARGKR